MVILKVGHHLYDDHHLFGTKQQQTVWPSHDEQYFGFGLRGGRHSGPRWVVWSPGGARCDDADCPRLRTGRSATWRRKQLIPYALFRRSALWGGWFGMAHGRLVLLVGPRSHPWGRDLRVLRVNRLPVASPNDVESPRN
jgi:hypothetical protein